jgi:hypothetical protein
MTTNAFLISLQAGLKWFTSLQKDKTMENKKNSNMVLPLDAKTKNKFSTKLLGEKSLV